MKYVLKANEILDAAVRPEVSRSVLDSAGEPEDSGSDAHGSSLEQEAQSSGEVRCMLTAADPSTHLADWSYPKDWAQQCWTGRSLPGLHVVNVAGLLQDSDSDDEVVTRSRPRARGHAVEDDEDDAPRAAKKRRGSVT